MRRSQKKTIFTVTVIVAVMLLAFAALSFMTAGFTQLSADQKTINPDNLYSTANIILEDTNDGNGITIDIDKNGAIKLSGKSVAENDLTYTIGTVTLDKGEYTLTACSKASFGGVYVIATVGSDVTYFDFTPGNVLEITADDTVVTLQLVVAEGAALSNVKVLPVISEGENIVDFYK